MNRLTEDRLLAERFTPAHIPAPDQPCADMRFRPDPTFARRVPTLDQLAASALDAGWHHHLDAPAEQTTELPAVARQDAHSSTHDDIIGYLVTAVIWGAIGAAIALLIGGVG